MSTGVSSSSSKSGPGTTRYSLSPTALRVFFVLSLIIAAVVCGVVSFRIITNLETSIGVETYESIAESMIVGAQDLTLRRLKGCEVTSTILSYAFPNRDEWPMVALNGYQHIAQKVADLSDSRAMGFAYLLDATNQTLVDDFESHAQQIYIDQKYPNGTGVSEFGFGVWKRSPTSPYKDKKVHDVLGETPYGSNYTVLAPMVEHNWIESPVMMFNIHSEQFRGVALDTMFECAERAQASESMTTPDCWIVTDWTELVPFPGKPAGMIYLPVYPANDPTHIVGIIGTTLLWEVVLKNIVPNYVSGLTCVISTSTRAATFSIEEGEPILLGWGDLHDPEFDNYERSIRLTDFTTDAAAAEMYTLKVYPTTVMLSKFNTQSAKAVSLGFVAVIVLCSCVFALYDYLMRNKSYQQKKILDIKRRFVRFISHEIRTPLNTVSMGLELLNNELRGEKEAKQLNKSSPDNSIHDESGCGDHHEEDVDFWLDVLHDARANCTSAVSVLNDLLNYDKIETQSLNIEIDTVRIWELIETTVNQFRIQAINKNVELNLNMPSTTIDEEGGIREDSVSALGQGGGTRQDSATTLLPSLSLLNVIGDDIRLTQVLRNLVSNALKFTPTGGTIDVNITHNPDGLPNAKPLVKDGVGDTGKERKWARILPRAGSITVEVKDSGAGMSQDQLDQLFREGVQFDVNKLQHGGGSGLGLAIANGIVKNHSGIIRVTSPGIGEGTTFVLELPLHEFPPEKKLAENDHTTTTSKTSISDGDGGADLVAVVALERPMKRHILVVEDTLSSRKMLVRLLERAGHTCVTATNGKEAIEIVKEDKQKQLENTDGSYTPIDTILMDFEMPVMNGPQAAFGLRRFGYQGILFGVTGNVLSEDVDYFLHQGADQVLGKPIGMAVLNEAWLKQH